MHCVPCTFDLVSIKATRTKGNSRVPQIRPSPLRQHVDSAMRLSIRWTLRGFVIFVAAYYTTRIITVHKNEKGPIRRTRSTRPLRPPTKDLIVRIVPKAVPRLVEKGSRIVVVGIILPSRKDVLGTAKAYYGTQ